jgi:hypothetical protein
MASTRPGAEDALPTTAITTVERHGECTYPVLDASTNHIAFLCTGDPLQNGTRGRRVFAMELRDEPPTLYQLTGRGDVQGPISHAVGQWFVTLSGNTDLTGGGACGYQVQILDYFPGAWNAATQPGQLPPDLLPASPFPAPESNVIGQRTFTFAAGDAVGGSRLAVHMGAEGVKSGTVGTGHIGLFIGPRELNGEAPVGVAAGNGNVMFPSVRVDGVGVVCLAARDAGGGMLDCDGGRPGADLEVVQDHSVGDVDPACVTGCREGNPCQGVLPGPHRGVCNGSMDVTHTGLFGPGAVQLRLPVTVGVSLEAGADGASCTGDDQYLFRGESTALELTTGKVTATVRDTDAFAGNTLSVTATGTPLDCGRLKARDMGQVQLVGALPLLDVPLRGVVRDIVVTVALEGRPPVALGEVCVAELCGVDADCDDENVCNGVEVCVNRTCSAGVPLLCDDGNACNGAEGCHPTTGACLPGRALVCDDANVCTVDGCDGRTGCVYGDALGPCDDEDACTEGDVCEAGACVGTPVVLCDDGDPCNGVETCDPQTARCLAGVAPGCDDGNPCTNDGCDADVGCVHVPNAAPCDDGNACTGGDRCERGGCSGVPVVLCDDADACNGVETCEPTTGQCVAGVALDCDDGNPCTDDACEVGRGCVHVDRGARCDDGNVCNGVETCDRRTGACVDGAPLECGDGDVCTDDLCTPGVGCVNVPVSDLPTCQRTRGVREVERALQALAREVQAASVEQLGGSRSQRRLDRLIRAARQQLSRAPAQRSLRRTAQQLGVFLARVGRDERRGRIDTGVATLLIDLGTAAAQEIVAAQERL